MQIIKKFIKKLDNPLVYGALIFLVGVAFIVLPEDILDIPIIIAGAVISLVGLTLALLPLGERQEGVISSLRMGLAMAKGGVIALLGVSLIIVRSGVSETVCDVLGVCIALWCATRLFRPSHLFRERSTLWFVESIAYVIFALGGLVILIFPLWPKLTAGIAILAVGAWLIYDGIRAMIQTGKAKPRDGEMGKAYVTRGKDVYSSDFIDRSEDK